jgi:hypothetical protein
MWLARDSAIESTIALITMKVATSPSVPAKLLWTHYSAPPPTDAGGSGFIAFGGPGPENHRGLANKRPRRDRERTFSTMANLTQRSSTNCRSHA